MSEEKSTASRESDEDFDSDIHDFRELLRSGDQEGLVSALENPELFRMACDDARYLQVVMQGISALAWDQPALASDLLLRFDRNNDRKDRDSDAGQTAWALLAALEWRQLQAEDSATLGQVGELRAFLRSYPALWQDEDHGRSLQRALENKTGVYSEVCAMLAQRTQVLSAWILSLEESRVEASDDSMVEISSQLPPVPQLSEGQEQVLKRKMAQLNTDLAPGAARFGVWMLMAVSVVLMPSAIGVLLALALLWISLALTEGLSYEKSVRPNLAAMAAKEGIGSGAILQWIYRQGRKAGRMETFDIKIEQDLGLEILACLSRCSQAVEA